MYSLLNWKDIGLVTESKCSLFGSPLNTQLYFPEPITMTSFYIFCQRLITHIFINTHVGAISILELLSFTLGEFYLWHGVRLHSVSSCHGNARLHNVWNVQEQPWEVTWGFGISRSPECLSLSPWGSLTQDLKSINLWAIKDTSSLLCLI